MGVMVKFEDVNGSLLVWWESPITELTGNYPEIISYDGKLCIYRSTVSTGTRTYLLYRENAGMLSIGKDCTLKYWPKEKDK